MYKEEQLQITIFIFIEETGSYNSGIFHRNGEKGTEFDRVKVSIVWQLLG